MRTFAWMNNPGNTAIHFGSEAIFWLKQELHLLMQSRNQVFLLADHNTEKHCIPLLTRLLGFKESPWQLITIPAGENSKTLENCALIWNQLLESSAGRNALLINLGGGMVTDIGGFVASVYKRGIPVIHLPTSLLGMVDAAIGNKTAIDFAGIKNPIGSFYAPKAVLIIPEFLETLPEREFRSGLAEVIKYGYIHTPELLQLLDVKLDEASDLAGIIHKCIDAKLQITGADPFEQGARKILNFGHTIGHAIEALSIQKQEILLHGEAVAIGMYCELWLSGQFFESTRPLQSKFAQWYEKHFEAFPIYHSELDQLIQFMHNDKKNNGKGIGFVLIEEAGKPHYDMIAEEGLIIKSLENYTKRFGDL